ncbi:Smr/MutS family protein [Roseibaca sp. V10]|uniref:Smr/MutS family protein n=1 Tax=Roseinatronobacter domitianus TaxID=2940293 RepID=A0ABT0M0M7_9RHOB|nr:Smr/MutS family protein [Roseibaca domitiana]MCL1627829.1 Smr/MutS family protein [Roseibaca domitiana]
MSRKKRPALSPEDRELWARVVQSARPLKTDLAHIFDTPPEAPAAPVPPKPASSSRVLRPQGSNPGPQHVLAQPLSEALAEAPVAMDKRRFQRMSRGKLQPEARIDLHGMTLAQAHGALNGFILRAQAEGLRLVLVITGKGRQVEDDGPIPRRRGALKHDVPQWLRMAPLVGAVLELREAHARHGGSGAYYVYLRRMR